MPTNKGKKKSGWLQKKAPIVNNYLKC